MKPIQCTLKIYWDDNVTIENRYFKSIRKAKKYIKNNGIVKYNIEY